MTVEIELDNTEDRPNKISKILDRMKGIKHKHIESDHDFTVRVKETFNPRQIQLHSNVIDKNKFIPI